MLYLCEYERTNTLGTGVVDFEEIFAGPYPPTPELVEWILDNAAGEWSSRVSVSAYHPNTLREDGFRLPAWQEFVATYPIDPDRVVREPVTASVGHGRGDHLATEVERLRVENSAHWDEILSLREQLRVALHTDDDR